LRKVAQFYEFLAPNLFYLKFKQFVEKSYIKVAATGAAILKK